MSKVLTWIGGFTILLTMSCSMTPSGKVPEQDKVMEKMMLVADWQLANLPDTIVKGNGGLEAVKGTSWHRAAFLTGLMALHRSSGEAKYLKAAVDIAQDNKWEPGPRKRHADDHCIIQTYVDLYFIQGKEYMIDPSKNVLDSIIDNPMYGPDTGWKKDWNWSWCDALFMAPPAYAMLSEATDDPSYLQVMDTLWWLTSDYLYDSLEHLYYRDENYKIMSDGTGPRSENGSKIFWGRGNGWVLGGLVRVLDYMPRDYPGRERFVQQYRQMALSVSGLQGADGLWRSSLLDPDAFPARETSSSGFFCYALAWGINQGILEKERYEPVVFKAWNGLVRCVGKDGKLGWVQLVGHDPATVSSDDTMEYGVGALLLAGSEVYKLINGRN